MSSALAQLKPFSLSSRAVYIKCYPTPRTFYERRAVLAALQKSTQHSIETFKKLQEDSSFLAVTTRPEAVASLLGESPMERTVYSQDTSSDETSTKAVWESEVDMSGPIARPVDPLPADDAAPTPAFADLGLSKKNFVLHIFPMNSSYNHAEEIPKSPIHGRWPRGGKTDTFISAALRRVVPSGAMAPALRDWETGNQLSHDSGTFATGEESAASALLGQKRHSADEIFYLERVRRRKELHSLPKIMLSLVAFAEGKVPAILSPDSAEPSQSTAPQESDGSWNDLPPSSVSRGQKPEALLDNEEFKRLLER